MLALTINTAPTAEPVTRDEVKLHSRISHTDEDSWIDSRIKSARLYVEAYTKRQLVTATWELRLDGFPPSDVTPIRVPLPPLSSVSSIAYLDTNGDSQTWSSSEYQTDAKSEPGRIMPAEGYSYPSTQADTFNTVTVTFVAGYGAASAVPDRFKTAILMLVDHWYEHRAAVSDRPSQNVEMAVQSLLMQDRVWRF